MSYLYTGSENSSATNTGLSTQIIVKVDGVTVGAIQSLRVNQRRSLKSIQEVGTDGNIEIVPSSATSFGLSIERIYFARKTITEALNRSFINIQAQRYPFDIYIYDMHNVSAPAVGSDYDAATDSQGVITTIYENCWIGSKASNYTASDYIIMENLDIEAEFCHTFVDSAGTSAATLASGEQLRFSDIERIVDTGRPGSMDARGLRTLGDLLAASEG